MHLLASFHCKEHFGLRSLVSGALLMLVFKKTELIALFRQTDTDKDFLSFTCVVCLCMEVLSIDYLEKNTLDS